MFNVWLHVTVSISFVCGSQLPCPVTEWDQTTDPPLHGTSGGGGALCPYVHRLTLVMWSLCSLPHQDILHHLKVTKHPSTDYIVLTQYWGNKSPTISFTDFCWDINGQCCEACFSAFLKFAGINSLTITVTITSVCELYDGTISKTVGNGCHS